MSGHRPFSELTKHFTAEDRRIVDEMTEQMLAEMPLHELRRARALTQKELAETMQVNQPAVSKLEKRTDAYISSLRSYIEAVGGRLKIVAEFPDGEVAITNFSDVGNYPHSELDLDETVVPRTKIRGHIKESEYPPAVIQATRELGGRAQARRVIERVGQILPLKDVDLEQKGPRSHVHFKYMARKARNRLVAQGLLYPWQVSGRGWWELTPTGRAVADESQHDRSFNG